MPPKFKFGDQVVRNRTSFSDSDQIPEESVGTIVHIFSGEEAYKLYAVAWETPIKGTYARYGYHHTWNIYEQCIDFDDSTISQEQRKLNRVITKIKELNERYAKSRTVSTKVGDQKPRESATSTRSDQPVPTGLEGTEGRVYYDLEASRSSIADMERRISAAFSSISSLRRGHNLSASSWLD